MSQQYYTQEQLDAYRAEHNVTAAKARVALEEMGLTRKRAKRKVSSPYYTEEQVTALAEERGITLTSAKSYLKRNYKGKRPAQRGSFYYTESQLQTYMEETGKSRNNAIAILRYRSLHPDSIPKPVIKPAVAHREAHSFSSEQVIVYMYQSGCTQEEALFNMCREQIIPPEYPSEHWVLENAKWTLITHNCL